MPSSPAPNISSPAPSSPYYNALVSAYVSRASSPSNLKVISTETKHALDRKVTRSEEKRRERERISRSMVNRERWWEKEVVKGGEDCTEHQKFLADNVGGFTGIYKQR
jgi:hypothetical protein